MNMQANNKAKFVTVSLMPADKLLVVKYFREVPECINQNSTALQSLRVALSANNSIVLTGREYKFISRSLIENEVYFQRLKKDYDLPETIQQVVGGYRREFLSKKTQPYSITLFGFAMVLDQSDVVDVEENVEGNIQKTLPSRRSNEDSLSGIG